MKTKSHKPSFAKPVAYRLVVFESVPSHGFKDYDLKSLERYLREGYVYVRQVWGDPEFGSLILTKERITQRKAVALLIEFFSKDEYPTVSKIHKKR